MSTSSSSLKGLVDTVYDVIMNQRIVLHLGVEVSINKNACQPRNTHKTNSNRSLKYPRTVLCFEPLGDLVTLPRKTNRFCSATVACHRKNRGASLNRSIFLFGTFVSRFSTIAWRLRTSSTHSASRSMSMPVRVRSVYLVCCSMSTNDAQTRRDFQIMSRNVETLYAISSDRRFP